MKLSQIASVVSALFFTLFLTLAAQAQDTSQDQPTKRWYRGNLHTHSFWSDGNDFPEMIAKWYSDNGYQFLSLTDHNILSRGERWIDQAAVQSRGGAVCIDKYQKAFDDQWIQTRKVDEKTQFKLCPLDRIRERFEKPGQFLLLEGEEVSDSVGGVPVHLNAFNMESLLRPTGGSTVREAIDANLRAAAEQASKTGRQIMVHLNHPNFGWAVTAEDLAFVTREKFFEVYNGHPGINQMGDKDHPSMERMWDIINTLRIDKLDSPPPFGLATDDSHTYHGTAGSHPGRGWVMVRATELSADALLTAMHQGDFYSSSGVYLEKVQYDPATRQLAINVQPQQDVTFKIDFIGTRRGYDETATPRLDDQQKPIRSTRIYSSDIGEILATVDGPQATYQVREDDLYVRAVITASRPHPDPSYEGQMEQAWTQPVGWK